MVCWTCGDYACKCLGPWLPLPVMVFDVTTKMHGCPEVNCEWNCNPPFTGALVKLPTSTAPPPPPPKPQYLEKGGGSPSLSLLCFHLDEVWPDLLCRPLLLHSTPSSPHTRPVWHPPNCVLGASRLV